MMLPMPNGAVELYVVRHAHAGDATRWTGDDARRPLTAKGRMQAERLAAHIAALRVDLEMILSSPKVRSRETAEPIARALGMPVRIDDRLGGGLTMRSLEDLLADAGDATRVLIVGHDPDLTDLVSELMGAASLPMRKGALARLDAARPLRPGGAILRWLIPPDALAGENAG
jgi:phosphohistidine phosphatase SixA